MLSLRLDKDPMILYVPVCTYINNSTNTYASLKCGVSSYESYENINVYI